MDFLNLLVWREEISTYFGINCIKTFLTHGDILCVAGDLKWTFRIPTVTIIESETNIIVNNKYLPNRGTARDVGGMISARSKKNTVRDRRIEIQRVT